MGKTISGMLALNCGAGFPARAQDSLRAREAAIAKFEAKDTKCVQDPTVTVVESSDAFAQQFDGVESRT